MISSEVVDARRRLLRTKSKQEAILAATKLIIQTGKKAIDQFGSFHIALSGGSTPKDVYSELSQPQYQEALNWSSVYIYFSDERCVPPTDKESNYRMAMDSGISALPISEDHLFRIHGEESPEVAAKNYEEILKARLKGRPFDLILLGVGEDGHTASLFPGTEALKESERLVVANFVPKLNAHRITFTFTTINAAHVAVVLAIGEKKEKIVNEILFENVAYPAGAIGTKAHPALWII